MSMIHSDAPNFNMRFWKLKDSFKNKYVYVVPTEGSNLLKDNLANTFYLNVALLALCGPLFTPHHAFLNLAVCQICLETG